MNLNNCQVSFVCLRYNIKFPKIKLTIILSLICFTSVCIHAQNLCQNLPANSVIGDFEIVGNILSGCSPLQIDLVDKSGGINVKYEFYYKDQAPSLLNKSGNDDKVNVYFSSKDIKTYTILQYGEKNGKPMYACKSISVLPNNKPKYTYSICSSQLEISIPKNPENNFDSYKVSWGSGNADITIPGNQLPFSASKAVTYPTQINVEGFYNNQTAQSCGNGSATTIQKLNLTNYPNGYSVPFDPNIDELVQNNSTEVTLKFRGSENIGGYTLNMRPIDGVYTSTPYKTNVTPGNILVNLPDSVKPYCFYFTRVSGCGSFEESAEVCTIKLNNPTYGDGAINLNWSNYPKGNRDYVSENNVHTFNKTIQIEKDFNGSKSLISLTSNTTNYLDQVECANNLKYRIQIKIEGLLWAYKYQSTIYSEWKNVDITKIKATQLTDLHITSNATNTLDLEFKNNSNWKTPVDKYFISEVINNIEILKDSVLVPNNIHIAKDASLQTYCYKINFRDQCGFYSAFSPEVCSLNLKIGSNNKLDWSMANPFGAAINELSLESKTDEVLPYNKFTSLSLNVYSYSPDYVSFKDKAYFRLKANTLVNSKESYSNFVEVPLKFSLQFPNIFTPNQDGLNETFFPTGNTSKINAYSIQIYNRWGNQVYESFDINYKWDGKNKHGKILPNGIYFAVVKYNNEKGELIRQTIPLYIMN